MGISQREEPWPLQNQDRLQYTRPSPGSRSYLKDESIIYNYLLFRE